MKTALEYRKISAKYYDEAYAGKEALEDLPFYLELATLSGGPVLEVGLRHGTHSAAHREMVFVLKKKTAARS